MTGITGYMHVALMHGISGHMITAELHGRLLSSGLYDASDSINVCIVGDGSETIIDYIFSRYKKYVVRYVSTDLEEWEWPTLRCMYKDCQHHDGSVYYIHTKGASNCRPDVQPDIQKNIRDWRGVMSHYCISDYRQRLVDLLSCDACGPFLSCNTDNGYRYFAGNFWWAKSQHIRSLVYPQGDRMSAETWIGTTSSGLTPTLHNLCTMPHDDPYDFAGDYIDVGVFTGLPGSDS